MEDGRGLLSPSTKKEEPPPSQELQTSQHSEYVVKTKPDETEKCDAQPDIHKVWIRAPDKFESNIKSKAVKLLKRSLKLSVADSQCKITPRVKKQTEINFSGTVNKAKHKKGKFLWNSLELSISDSVTNKKLTPDQLQRNSTELNNRCLKVSEQWPKSASHLKRISQMVVRKTTPAILIPCSVCTKTFNFKSALTRHMFTHFGEETVKCDVCQRSIRKGNLLRHIKAHKLEKSFNCPECFKKFKHKMSLESHAKSHNPQGVGDPVTCEQCNKKCTPRTTLIGRNIRSLQSNIPEHCKPFLCEECNNHSMLK